MERWKILHSAKNLKLKAGTRNESCGRFGKRTPFLRDRVQLHRQKDQNQKRAHTVSSFSFYKQRKLLQMEEFIGFNDSY